ncbi:YciI-like protein [compost metagenome]
MNKILFLLLLVVSTNAVAQVDNPKYDKALAESLGADAYGMKIYILVILKAGTAKIEDNDKLNQLFKGHMESINKLAAEGKLVVAGPIAINDKNYKGIFIFNVKTAEEATALLAGDPAIQEKLFEVEILQWYGSAALGEHLKVHEKIEQKKH